jgi:hypothetical protein
LIVVLRHFRRACGDIPIGVCGNRVDELTKQLKKDPVALCAKRKCPYFTICIKKWWNIEKPLLWLARTLTGENTLQFVSPPAYMPPWPLAHPTPNEDVPSDALPEDEEEEDWKVRSIYD